MISDELRRQVDNSSSRRPARCPLAARPRENTGRISDRLLRPLVGQSAQIPKNIYWRDLNIDFRDFLDPHLLCSRPRSGQCVAWQKPH